MRHRGRTLAIVLLALAMGACAGEDARIQMYDAADSTTPAGLADSEGVAAPADDGGERGLAGEEKGEVGADANYSLGSGGADPAVLTPADLGRDIIYTADLTVAVNDVAAAGNRASQAIRAMGGFVFGQQATGGASPRNVLVFKVFPEDFQEALDRLGEIGEMRNQEVSADDVTERVVDLASRIRTAEASVERLRVLLSQAKDISVIADLENRLLERETGLELLRGQLRTLQDQVALATIVLTIIENTTTPSIAIASTVYAGHDGEGLGCPGETSGRIEQGTEYTVCLEVTNDGEFNLDDIALRDPVLDIDLEKVLVVSGNPDEVLEPGESITLAVEMVAVRDIRTRTTVTAIAVDAEGNPLPGKPAEGRASSSVIAYDPGGIPTFGEGFERSIEVLANLGQFALLSIGLAIPFLWVPLLLWLLVWWLGQRSRPRIAAKRVAQAGEPSED